MSPTDDDEPTPPTDPDSVLYWVELHYTGGETYEYGIEADTREEAEEIAVYLSPLPGQPDRIETTP